MNFQNAEELGHFIQGIVTAHLQAVQPPQQPHQGRLKPAKPENFNGKESGEAENWLFQFQQYFRAVHVNNEAEQVLYAASFLRGPAETWWRSHNLLVDAGEAQAINTWAAFSAALLETFRPVNAKKIARDRLAMLRQVDSVQGYTYEFRLIALEIPGLTDEEKLDRYVRGLKPATRREVEVRDPTTFDEAARIAERYDQISFQRNRVRMEGFGSEQMTVPMELGAITYEDGLPKNKLSQDELRRRKKLGLCFVCGKSGHMKNECPNRAAQ